MICNEKVTKMNDLHDIVERADAVVILAGAGMGVDSGLPDFRGTQGLWKEYPELMNRDLNFEEMANPKWFREDAKLAWAFYGHRLHKYLEVQPHTSFDLLLELCKSKNDDYFVVTSNVDNHFKKAGFDPMKIHEVHGSLAYFQCIYGCKRDIWAADYDSVVVDKHSFIATSTPSCPHCGKLARPNVLMFDDYGWLCERERRQRKRFESWKRNMRGSKKKVLIIEIGAGKAIATIRRIAECLYLQEFHESSFVRINPRDCDVPDGAISIQSGGLDGITTLLQKEISNAG